jgi:ABC-type lipoprotein release transport system permease subunit
VAIADAVIGAAAGYLLLWSIYWLFKLLTGKEGMGFGDFKLLAALGAWLGWQSTALIILLSSVVGACWASFLPCAAAIAPSHALWPLPGCRRLDQLIWGPGQAYRPGCRP